MLSKNKLDRHEVKLFVTSSDLSDLLVPDSQPSSNFNKSIGFYVPEESAKEQSLKVANFKKIDWKALESNLIEQKKTKVNPLKAVPQSNFSYRKRSHAPTLTPVNHSERLDLANNTITRETSKVDWVSYLPRVRKSLRGLNPKNLQGEYWPQQQRTLTYKNGIRVAHNNEENDRLLQNERFGRNYGMRVGLTEGQMPFTPSPINNNTIRIRISEAAQARERRNQSVLERHQETPLGQREMDAIRAQSVTLIKEPPSPAKRDLDVSPGFKPGPSTYNQTFFNLSMKQVTSKNNSPMMSPPDLSILDPDKLPTEMKDGGNSPQSKFMSPRLTKTKLGGMPNLDIIRTLQQSPNDSHSTHEKKEFVLESDASYSDPTSAFQRKEKKRKEGLANVVPGSYKISYRAIGQEGMPGLNEASNQPSQLMIETIAPIQKQQQPQEVRHQVLKPSTFVNSLAEKASTHSKRSKASVGGNQMQVIVALKDSKGNPVDQKTPLHHRKRSQQFNLKSNRVSTLRRGAQSTTPQQRATVDASPTSSFFGQHRRADSVAAHGQPLLREAAKRHESFGNTVKNLYHRDGKTGKLHKHAGDYLSRVERLREQSKTQLLVSHPLKLESKLSSEPANAPAEEKVIQKSDFVAEALQAAELIRDQEVAESSEIQVTHKCSKKSHQFGNAFSPRSTRQLFGAVKKVEQSRSDIGIIAHGVIISSESKVQLQQKMYQQLKSKDASLLIEAREDYLQRKKEARRKVNQSSLEKKLIREMPTPTLSRINSDINRIMQHAKTIKQQIEVTQQSNEQDESPKQTVTLQNSDKEIAISPNPSMAYVETLAGSQTSPVRKVIQGINTSHGRDSDGETYDYNKRRSLDQSSGGGMTVPSTNIVLGQRYFSKGMMSTDLFNKGHDSTTLLPAPNSLRQSQISGNENQKIQQTSPHSTLDSRFLQTKFPRVTEASLPIEIHQSPRPPPQQAIPESSHAPSSPAEIGEDFGQVTSIPQSPQVASPPVEVHFPVVAPFAETKMSSWPSQNEEKQSSPRQTYHSHKDCEEPIEAPQPTYQEEEQPIQRVNLTNNVHLEGIYVRKGAKQQHSHRPCRRDQPSLYSPTFSQACNNVSANEGLYPQDKSHEGRIVSEIPPSRHLNLQSIPDQIRTLAVFKSGMTMGPRKAFKAISVERDRNAAATFDSVKQSQKAKRIEEVSVIVSRVERANCCYELQSPEDFQVLSQAVGDGSEYIDKPSQKAFRIRFKFLNNNFLQSASEDFMYVQNLERHVDETIIVSQAMFKQFEIENVQEQNLMIRLFKRFYYLSVQKKYGYIKPNAPKGKVEISGKLLMNELELNPKVLRLTGVITTFSGDASLSWLAFLRIMTLFLLLKDVRQMRFDFILRFLHLVDEESLYKNDYIQERMQRFQFNKRGLVATSVPVLVLWNKIRVELARCKDTLFCGPHGEPMNSLNLTVGLRALMESEIEAEDTQCFFNSVFDLS